MAQKAQSGGATPQRKIELFSGTYFGACTLGGIIGMQQPIRFLRLWKQFQAHHNPKPNPQSLTRNA